MTTAALTDDAASYGPAMAALNERQRGFVSALFAVPGGHGAPTRAARLAGYGTPTSSAQTMASISSRLCSDEKIQLAIQEESRKYITTLGPLAVRALTNLVLKPSHKEHGRALGILMDRVLPVATTHTVRVEHDATPSMKATAEVLARMYALAARVGVEANHNMPPMIEVKAE